MVFSHWCMSDLVFCIVGRYEGQRDMLYNQTFNLDQVSFAAEGIKDAQQTVSIKNLTWSIIVVLLFASCLCLFATKVQFDVSLLFLVKLTALTQAT